MWSSSKVPYHLPKARGNYVPGVADVMLDYSRSGIFMRMYYPTGKKLSIESNHERWAHAIPDYSYLKGISNVVMIPSIIMWLIWLKSGKLRIPALYGEKVKTDEKLKCIVFSHGLGALRSFYSAICVELASRGYLVAVIEHRDESACYTYYYNSKEDAAKDKKTNIEFKTVPVGKGHYDTRKTQVTYRTEEMCKALDFLIDLNRGTVPHNVFDDVPADMESKFDLADLVGKIDMDNLIIAGHSFGAATALNTLGKRKEFKLGLILDPWMFPVKEEKLETKITQPLLFINTQTFHIKTNIASLAPFLSEGNESREMYTLLKTTHEVQTDSVFIAGYWLNWFMDKIDPRKGLLLNNSLMLKFMKQHTKHAEEIKDCENALDEYKAYISSGLTKPWA